MNRVRALAAIALCLWDAPLRAQDGTPAKGDAQPSTQPSQKGDGLIHGLIRGLVNTAVREAVKKASEPKTQTPAAPPQGAAAPATQAPASAPSAVAQPVAAVVVTTPAAPPSAVSPPPPAKATTPAPAVDVPIAPRPRRDPVTPSTTLWPKVNAPRLQAPTPPTLDSATVLTAAAPVSKLAPPELDGPADSTRPTGWLWPIGLVLAAAAAALALHARRITRTRSLVSISHRFDPDAGGISLGPMKFAAPPVSIRVRLDRNSAYG